MIKRILSAASWLGVVQIFNTLSVLALTAFVIRKSSVDNVSLYMYAVFLTDAVMSYTLAQISQRIMLVKTERQFERNFIYGLILSLKNIVGSLVCLALVVFFIARTEIDLRFIGFVGFLAVASICNYLAGIAFVRCDYEISYRPYAFASVVSNLVSIVVAILLFQVTQDVYCMIARDVVRALILLAISAYSVGHWRERFLSYKKPKKLIRNEFLFFVLKRHALKVVEVSNHRVPALVMAGGSLLAVGEFGVAFQFTSQIMGLLAIVSDRIAYAWFATANASMRRKYLIYVAAVYAVCAIGVYLFGREVFLLFYGSSWVKAADIFSLLSVYLFAHGTLVVVSNYLLAVKKFVGVYLSWVSWLICFAVVSIFAESFAIVDCYVASSVVSLMVVLVALFVAQPRFDGRFR